MKDIENIGFVSTRIIGTDGVSLEIGKWEAVLERMGYQCFFICGECDRPEDRTCIIEVADYEHPDIHAIESVAFGRETRTRQVTEMIDANRLKIKDQLYDAVKAFDLDLLIVENALTIPMNIPLGVALAQFIIETGIPCIAHHHDFHWERQRYLINAVDDYLTAAFPPSLWQIEHVVINTGAGAEFSRRTGLSCRLIPNVMDFSEPPAPPDDYASDFRSAIGVADDDILIVQPTRVVRRKGIEHTIELVHRLDDPRCKVLITHDETNLDSPYARRIRDYADLLSVDLIEPAQRISNIRGETPEGEKQYAIWDVYPHADLVAYPSTYEGFGNAFLEALYYRKCVFANRYSAYLSDIEPYGFQAVVMDGFLSESVVDEVRDLLSDKQRRKAMADHNYELGRQFFSFDRLENELRSILETQTHIGPSRD